MAWIDVLHDDQRRRKIGRQRAEHMDQRVQPAGGSGERDDVEARGCCLQSR